MSEKTEAGTQTFDSSSESIELGLTQESGMEPTVDETPADEPTLKGLSTKGSNKQLIRYLEE